MPNIYMAKAPLAGNSQLVGAGRFLIQWWGSDNWYSLDGNTWYRLPDRYGYSEKKPYFVENLAKNPGANGFTYVFETIIKIDTINWTTNASANVGNRQWAILLQQTGVIQSASFTTLGENAADENLLATLGKNLIHSEWTMALGHKYRTATITGPEVVTSEWEIKVIDNKHIDDAETGHLYVEGMEYDLNYEQMVISGARVWISEGATDGQINIHLMGSE